MLLATFGLTAVGQDKGGKTVNDQEFVMKAAASGLAEVNLSTEALTRASNASVRKFAQKMVDDHMKANKELIDLANKKGWKVAAKMDAKHEKLSAKLLKLSGNEFDRAFMSAQVKDHVEAVSLFERASKGAKDEELRAWAKKTLPHLREHLKMARDVAGSVTGDKEKAGKSSKD